MGFFVLLGLTFVLVIIGLPIGIMSYAAVRDRREARALETAPKEEPNAQP